MRKQHLFFVIAVFCITALTFSACNNVTTEEKAEEVTTEMEATTDKNGPEFTSAYICPMHCPGSGSAEPGKCPECGMDYVKNENYKGEVDAHEGHDHNHDNHDHGSHEGHNH